MCKGLLWIKELFFFGKIFEFNKILEGNKAFLIDYFGLVKFEFCKQSSFQNNVETQYYHFSSF